MVTALESRIDALDERFDMPTEFVVPGQTRVAALLDVARTVVRRAERLSLALADGSQVGPYLNRLSDLCWTMARWQEDEHLPTRPGGARPRRRPQRET
jgi:cob(I)alamin adenosyltransferase